MNEFTYDINRTMHTTSRQSNILTGHFAPTKNPIHCCTLGSGFAKTTHVSVMDWPSCTCLYESAVLTSGGSKTEVEI